VLPGARLIGVQAEAVAPVPGSLEAGQPVSVTPAPTMADGIAVARPGELTVALLSALGAQVVTVTEENLSRGLLLCLERAKQVVEPAGAAGIAAVLEHPALFEPPVVVVLSGGNIDPLLLSKVLRHGLSAAGRFLAFRCRLPDRPGALATLLVELASLGANVLDVVHERVTADLRVDEATVSLHLETRGQEHADSVVSQLRKAGYTLLFG
jgi:threonine dehydratase